ncbi:unnamed protein product [Caenorhabditis bovis]|nr:unnamed protein product [Caenorhabditis bovis]
MLKPPSQITTVNALNLGQDLTSNTNSNMDTKNGINANQLVNQNSNVNMEKIVGANPNDRFTQNVGNHLKANLNNLQANQSQNDDIEIIHHTKNINSTSVSNRGTDVTSSYVLAGSANNTSNQNSGYPSKHGNQIDSTDNSNQSSNQSSVQIVTLSSNMAPDNRINFTTPQTICDSPANTQCSLSPEQLSNISPDLNLNHQNANSNHVVSNNSGNTEKVLSNTNVSSTKDVPSPTDKKSREDVDMEEIFKTVIEDASRSSLKNFGKKESRSHHHQIHHHYQQHHHYNKERHGNVADNSMPLPKHNPATDNHQTVQKKPVVMNESFHFQAERNMQTECMSNSVTMYQQNGYIEMKMPIETTSPLMPQNPHQRHELDINFFDTEPYPNIDEMVANMSENDDIKINLDSDELATILGDDWLDTANRNIDNQGQYDPQSPNSRMKNNQDTLYPGNSSMSNQQNMDWFDQMIQNHDSMNCSFD